MEYQSIAPLGKVNIITDTDALGQIARFLDLDHNTDEDGIKRVLSGHPVFARLCYNNSGGTLAAGLLLKGDTGSTYGPLKGTLGAAGATDSPIGVVDPFITSAVPIGGFFWCLYYGPAKVQFTTGTTIDENDLLIAGATGYVDKATVGTSSPHYHVGRSLEAVDTAIASGTLFRAFLNIQL